MIKTVAFYPSRIGCPSIPGTIKGILMSKSGVQNVKVFYEQRSLEVTFDTEKTNEDVLTKAIGQETGLSFQSGAPHAPGTTAAETCPM